jgi:curved DNA-binding protein CbpA
MSDHEVDYYVLLGIEYSASEKEIRKAYRIKSLTCHPDKVAATDTNAANLFQLINKAVDTLTDPLKKVKYDNIHKAERLHKKRMEEMDKERRFDREKLHQNEQEHERKRKDFNQSELDKIQINLIRENNILKMRAKQEIKRQEIISSISTVLQTKQMESKIKSAEPFDCSVKIRFKKDDGSGKDRAKKDVDASQERYR